MSSNSTLAVLAVLELSRPRPSCPSRARVSRRDTRTGQRTVPRQVAQRCGNHNLGSNVAADMTATCTASCRATVAGNATLCRRCARALRQKLAELPALLDDLAVAFTRQAVLVEQAERTRANENPLLFNVTAANQYRHIQRILDRWVNQFRHHHRFVPIHPSDQARWLANKMHEITRHLSAGSLYLDVITLHRETLAMIDQPAGRSRFPVGPCPQIDDDGAQCAGNVWAIIPDTPGRAPVLSCRTCDTTWEAHQWRKIGRHILAAMNN